MISAAVDDGSEEAAHEAHHEGLVWYLSTFALLAIPFRLHARTRLDRCRHRRRSGWTLHLTRIIVAGHLDLPSWSITCAHHRVRVTLMLPLFFAALLEDFGFYTLAPFFIIGVMYLFGERRAKPMVLIMALIYGLLLLLFVNILFVGLPVGNIRPFYDIGSWIVTVLQ